jgi:hypothetical protein
MTATQDDIKKWLEIAQAGGYTHMITGLDPMDYENFPIYCDSPGICLASLEDLKRTGNSYDEVYDLSLPIDEQLAEPRALHIPDED